MAKHYIPGVNLVGDTKKHSTTDQLEMIKNAGFGAFFTGWNHDRLPLWTEEAAKRGLIYQSIHSPFSGDWKVSHMWNGGEEGKRVTDMLISCVEDCAHFNIPVMVIHPFIGFKDHTPTQVGLDNYARVIDVADRLGVKLGFENVEGEEYLAAIMEKFWDAPSLGFCYDTGHQMCYNEGKRMMALYGEKLCHTHFNDNLGVYNPKFTWENDLHLPLGEGIVRWDEVMDDIDASPYEGVLMCELTLANKPGSNRHDVYAKMPLEEFYAHAYDRVTRVINRTIDEVKAKG